MKPIFKIGQDVIVTSFTGVFQIISGDKVKIKDIMFDEFLKKNLYLVTKGDAILWCSERELKINN